MICCRFYFLWNRVKKFFFFTKLHYYSIYIFTRIYKFTCTLCFPGMNRQLTRHPRFASAIISLCMLSKPLWWKRNGWFFSPGKNNSTKSCSNGLCSSKSYFFGDDICISSFAYYMLRARVTITQTRVLMPCYGEKCSFCDYIWVQTSIRLQMQFSYFA